MTTGAFLRAAPNPVVEPDYASLPLSFEENRGQAPGDVRYVSRTGSGVVFLRPGSFSLDVESDRTISVRFLGGSGPSTPAGEQKLIGTTSYLIGDRADWIHGVPTYASVRYASVYPGIDAVFHGNREHLEYDFVLRPGADPAQIRLAFEGADRIAVDAEGNLELSTPKGRMRQLKPRIWQTGPHGREEVAGRYALSGPAEARFVIDRHDPSQALVIDPVIKYSTYFGSVRDDRARAVATDSTGATYLAGSTATGGISWGFVSKVNAGGTAVLYTVYFGSGVCDAAARGIGVDSLNNAVVTGFYVQQSAAGACNVKRVLGAKINPAGDTFLYQLVWGGNQDAGNAVAVDGSGNAYFTGATNGGFPTTAGVIYPSGWVGQDAFITKLSPTGVLIYSTYLGGSLSDEGLAIAVDTSGNAFVGGATSSDDSPATANAVQGAMPNLNEAGFVTKVNKTATQVLYSTFLGGTGHERVVGIAVDGQGKIHVTGNTVSSDFPTSANAWDRTCGLDGTCGFDDAFYSKIDPLKAGAAGLTYSTFLGGANRDYGEAIAIDKNGRAWITGSTASADFPKAAATQGTFGGNSDAFVAQVDPALSGAASLRFSSFLGGSLYDEGTGVQVDSLGDVHVVGYTGSLNFPVASALQPTNVGGNEGFILKITAPALATIAVNPGTVTDAAGSTGTVTLSAPAPAGGAVVTLTSSKTNAATVPPSVTVAAGARTATFAITTKAVTAGTVATITATYDGISKSIGLVVNPLLGSLTLNPSVLSGGAGSTGMVTLTTAAPAGGAVVSLTSANASVATVPTSVTVPAGATSITFAVTTKAVATVTQVNITAVCLGASRIVTLTVNPATVGLTGVSVNPAAVVGGAGSTGTVTLGVAAPAGGAIVMLTSSNTTAATVPPSVTVPAGATTATFAITSKTVTAATAVTITATYSAVAKTATLTVNPPAALASVTMNPATMIFGSTSKGTVTLTSAAPAGGAVVALSSSDWVSFVLPASVTIPAGAKSAQFTVSTAIAKSTTVITATYNGVNKNATLTSVYPTVNALTCTPNPVIGGNTTICTVTMNGIMPAATTVWVLSDQPFIAPASGTLTVPAGAATAAFSIATALVPERIVANISASALATATVTAPLTIDLTNRGRKWVLNNVVFKDGGTANGYFIYDAVTGQYLAVNIRVTAGSDQANPLGHSPQDLYYYPWPNGTHPTFVNNGSTASMMALQNPVTDSPASWTLLQFNFAQPLTNAGGTIPLVINPTVFYTPYCANDPSPTCTPPPPNISQERFSLPDNIFNIAPVFYYRVVVSGTVIAQ